MQELLDLKTIAICNAMTSYVLAMTLASARSRLVEMRGIREFVAAAVLGGTSFVFAAVPSALFPGAVHSLFAVPGMTLAVGLMYVGVSKFTSRPNPLAWVVASAFVMLALTIASLHTNSLLPVRMVSFSVLNAAWAVLAGVHILRYVDRELGFGRVMGACALLGIGATFLFRAASLLLIENDPAPLGENNTNRLAFFVGTALMLFALAGAAAMVNTRIGLEIARIAERDLLTGLLSRFGLRHASAKWMANHRQGHLLLIDLDHFKSINDQLGHERGDTVLRAFAELAVPLLPADSLLARYGGDEFLALIPERSNPELFGHELIARFDERVAELLGAHAVGARKPSLSVGIAVLRDSFGTAVREADRALYRAKADGRARIATASREERSVLA